MIVTISTYFSVKIKLKGEKAVKIRSLNVFDLLMMMMMMIKHASAIWVEGGGAYAKGGYFQKIVRGCAAHFRKPLP